MWIHNQLRQDGGGKSAALAPLTFAEDGGFGAAGEREWREMPVFGPGVAYQPREEDQLLALDSDGGTVCAGVRMDLTGLEPGELRLGWPGGACILLRKDGSILLNGAVITPQGELLPPEGGQG